MDFQRMFSSEEHCDSLTCLHLRYFSKIFSESNALPEEFKTEGHFDLHEISVGL